MKFLPTFLIFVLITIISINGHCITEDQKSEAQKSSVLHSFISGIHCGLQVGAKKTGDAIRNSIGFVKKTFTPTKKEVKIVNEDGDGRTNTDFVYDIDVRSDTIDSQPDSNPEVTTVKMSVNERAMFVAPCNGYTDRRGRCRPAV